VIDETLLDAEEKMEKAVSVAKDDLATLRTGRANPGMFSHIVVDYYGSPTPLNQLASVNVPEARMVVIKPYDASQLGAMDKAIRDSDLGLNPSNDGTIIRVVVPQLSEERRRELIKVVKHEAENARVAVRNLRRDAIHSLKEGLKKKEVSENDERRAQDEVQKMTDRNIAEIDKLLQQKETELLAV